MLAVSVRVCVICVRIICVCCVLCVCAFMSPHLRSKIGGCTCLLGVYCLSEVNSCQQ